MKFLPIYSTVHYSVSIQCHVILSSFHFSMHTGINPSINQSIIDHENNYAQFRGEMKCIKMCMYIVHVHRITIARINAVQVICDHTGIQ